MTMGKRFVGVDMQRRCRTAPQNGITPFVVTQTCATEAAVHAAAAT